VPKAGKIIKVIGSVVGTAAEYNIKLSGKVVGGAARLANNDKLANKAEAVSNTIGNAVGKGTKITTSLAGNLVDLALDKSIKIVKKVGKSTVKTEVKIYGDTKNFYDDEKYIQADFEIIK
jgi:hypothetical protein